MKEFKPILNIEEFTPDLEFEAQILETNNIEIDLLNKKRYKIKKSIWNGYIAS